MSDKSANENSIPNFNSSFFYEHLKRKKEVEKKENEVDNSAISQNPLAKAAKIDQVEKIIENQTVESQPIQNINVPQYRQQTYSSKHIKVNPCQYGNPILQHLKQCPWSYVEADKINTATLPDYIIDQSMVVLYLSLKYHKLHPEYIYQRVNRLKNSSNQLPYRKLIILCQVDVQDFEQYLLEMHKFTIDTDNLGLVLCWSEFEAGGMLEVIKLSANSNIDSLKQAYDPSRTEIEKLELVLRRIKTINKTDTSIMLNNFTSFRSIVNADINGFAMCPGFGKKKIKQLEKAFKLPFLVKNYEDDD